MTKAELIAQIKLKSSFLCVGLDPDLSIMPPHLLEGPDPLFEFCKAIIDATHPYAVAFNPNTAFFECHVAAGWEALQKTIAYIPNAVCIPRTSRLLLCFFERVAKPISFITCYDLNVVFLFCLFVPYVPK